MRKSLGRILLAFTALISAVAVITARPTPAGACVDWTDQTIGDLGYIPSPEPFGAVKLAPDGTIVTGQDRYSSSGDLLNSYPGFDRLVDVLDNGNRLISNGDGISLTTLDGAAIPGFTPVVLPQRDAFAVAGDGHMAYVSSPDQRFTGKIGEVVRLLPDGTPDTGFGGTGGIEVQLDLGANNPGDQPIAKLAHPNDTGGVDMIVSWSQTQPGYALEYIRIEPDGEVNLLGRERYEGAFPVGVASPIRTPERLEFLQVELRPVGSWQRGLVVVGLDLGTGEFDVVRTLPDVPEILGGGGFMAVDRDGFRLVALREAYTVLGPDTDPLLSNGSTGDWVLLDDPERPSNNMELTAGLALPEGGFLVRTTSGENPAGLYAWRGGQEPALFVEGALSDEITRIYSAGLGRAPDATGLAYFSNLRVRGASLESIAGALVASEEFQSRFGALEDREFVEQLYRFVLGREGDAEGVDYWTQILEQESRAAILAFFAQSRENIQATGSLLADVEQSAVYRLYQAVFLRRPDVDGFCFWMLQLDAGNGLSTLASAFVEAPEFILLYGDLDNAQFVDQIYRNVLGRPGDAEGVAYWISLLDAGVTRGDVVVGFSESAEFRLRTDTIGR